MPISVFETKSRSRSVRLSSFTDSRFETKKTFLFLAHILELLH